MFEIGRHERETLEREREALSYRKRMDWRGLTQIEARRLDDLERILGVDSPPARNSSEGK